MIFSIKEKKSTESDYPDSCKKMFQKSVGCGGPTQNKKDKYSVGRFIAKPLHLPTAGRAEPLSILLLRFPSYSKSHLR